MSSPPFPTLPDSPPAFRLGFVRSLRPRKPIQQHPYLLEGAQYAQAMKSHGVKPVRIEFSSGPRKQTTEEDSQDPEFQQSEESQLPRQRLGRASPSVNDSIYDFPSSQTDMGQGPVSSTLSPNTSTPLNRFLPLSSQEALENGTDNTSLPDEDDFPTPRTFRQQQYKRLQNRAAKRQGSPRSSAAAKRARTVGDIPNGTLPPKWIPVRMDSSPDQLPRSGARARARPVPLRSPSPTARPSALDIFTITDDEDDDRDSSGNAGNNGAAIMTVEDIAPSPRSETDESQSDSEAVRKNSKRIKGVLPASWLRLDQQRAPRVAADKLSATQRMPLQQQHDQAPRKGVALRRQGQGTSSSAALFPLFDVSDDENDNDNDSVVVTGAGAKNPTGDTSPRETTEGFSSIPRYHIIDDDDDIGSVMEDNSIDRMAPGVKRHRISTVGGGGPRAKKQRVRTSSLFRDGLPQKTQQPKITKALTRKEKAAYTGAP
ncbi:MAG: hypothetical protein STHCBS139747_000365 [Sporothrix thermara]